MKKWIRKLVPPRVGLAARRLHWAVFGKTERASLTALRCRISYNKYGGYCVPDSSAHRPAAWKILAHDVYEPKTIEFMRENCGAGDVVHAGTYFGDFLPALSKACAADQKIWAFEPNPENFRCAKITIEINGIDNVVLTHAALGARREQLLLETTDETGRSLGGASRIVTHDSASALAARAVDVVAVDEVIGADRVITLMQLDVEGHEKEALEGALETIRRCHPILILEVQLGSDLFEGPWFALNILSLGYRRTTPDLHGNAIFLPDQRDRGSSRS